MEKQKPLTNPEIQKVIEQMPSMKTVNESHSILIIDDDTWIQRIISHYLQSWGFKTYSALDAYEGISLAIKHRPVLIILDIIMPEVEGDIVLKMLKRIEMIADVPVLVISSNLNLEVLGHTFRDGAAGFISKPFSQQILYEKIKSCLSPTIFNQIERTHHQLASTPDINDAVKKEIAKNEVFYQFNSEEGIAIKN